MVDDFAHNPAKIAAALATAHLRAPRACSPSTSRTATARRASCARTSSRRSRTSLRPGDRAWLLEVFYAGGTAVRDFSSADIVAEIVERGRQAEFAPSREWLVARLADVARPGDLVLVMGARDPSLTEFAKGVLGEARGDAVGLSPA